MVLWDMDGTLVDTEPYWIAAEKQLVAEHGGTWSDADAHSVVGFALLDTARQLRDRGGVALDLTDIVEWLLDRVIDECAQRLPWRPGAPELLAECQERGIPCGLVTMSWQRLASAVADAAPLGSFAEVVSGDMVANGKPHPDPYLTAAARFGVDPGRCLAIEDSPTGVASAVAAGCVTIAVPHVVAFEPPAAATLVPSLAGRTINDLVTAVGAR